MASQVAQDKAKPDANERLGELMLYVAERCGHDPGFGSTKLNKILFYADFLAYSRLGKPITGAEYQKLPFGPAPRYLKPVERELTSSGAAVVQQHLHFGRVQHRLIPLRESNLELFSGAEIAIVEQIIEVLRDHNASEVSELSHQFAGWQLAELGETIPYFTALIPDEDWQPDPEVLARGAELLESLRS